jgi:hypothetical protein
MKALAPQAATSEKTGLGAEFEYSLSACLVPSPPPIVVYTHHISTIHCSFAERSSGRNPTSKPLKPSATGSAASKPSRTASVHSTTVAHSRTPSRSSDSVRFKVTKLSSTTVTLPTTWAQKKPVCATQIHSYFLTDRSKSDVRRGDAYF